MRTTARKFNTVWLRNDEASEQEQSGGSLLTTKFYLPKAHPNQVARARLIARLEKAVQHKLSLISAPAGFGKTTLLSEWATSSPLRVAWLSLDKNDNDPAQFWAYVIAALQTLRAGVGEQALALLHSSPETAPLEVVLNALLNTLAPLTPDFVLVLDDYHLIEAAAIHESLAYFLEHLPPQMHLIIATRSDPPLPLARLRVRRQLNELRANELRFTKDEARTFLNEMMGLGLAADEIAQLSAHTEGWVAGLQLAALSMQGREAASIGEIIGAFNGSHHYVLDYLAEEVLRRQPEEVQAFLMETAVLNRLGSAVCDAITGQANAQAMLERLERDNLFIVPLDERREWYRYHHLFAEFLCNRLQRLQPERVACLHRRASEWYAQHGMMNEAIGQALAGEDFEGAARLIEQHQETMLLRGEITTLLGWLEALPSELVRVRSSLGLFYAWVLVLTGELDTVEPLLQAIEARAETSEKADNFSVEAGNIAAIRAFVARYREDTNCAIQLSEYALKHLPPDQLIVRGAVTLNLGYAFLMKGEIAAASRAFDEASRLGQQAGHIYVALSAMHNRAKLLMLQGQLRQAERLCQQALQLVPSQSLPAVGAAYVGMGEVLREWNDLGTAEAYLTKGIELGELAKNLEVIWDGYITLARVKQGQGNLDGARQTIEAVEELSRKYGWKGVGSQVAAYQARLGIVQGKLEVAESWAEAWWRDTANRLNHRRVFEYLTLVRVLMAQNRPDEALELMKPVQEVAEQAGWCKSLMEIHMLQALCQEAQGQSEQASLCLNQALIFAEQQNFIRLFADEGASMKTLLLKNQQLISPEFLNKLLAAFTQPTETSVVSYQSSALTASNPPSSVLTPPPSVLRPHSSLLTPFFVEPLSDREQEVLQLIALGKSNREIAEDLVVTEGTIKWHIKNTYGKLKVQSRTQAVARGRELGLL